MEKQWWITGFDPKAKSQSIDADKLVQISSVDFSENPEMLSKIKETWEGKDKYKYLIIDMEDSRLWIIW